MNTIILGAGITGLAAAYKTQGTVYESSDHPGGLCRTYYLGGYQFEVGGGHWIFGAKEVMEFIDKFCAYKTYKRNAGVYIHKTFSYPIQKYFTSPERINSSSFKEWLFEQFGQGLCKFFFYPFNEKYTAGLYNNIAPQDNYKNPIDNSGYNSEFIYPEGGLGFFISNIAERVRIVYNKEAVRIDPAEKIVYFTDGSVKYDRLISTLPLNKMCKLLGIEESLPYNSTIVLNIGATKGKNCPKEHWLYVPYCESGFHRIGFYSNVDPSFAPNNRVGIYVEWAFLNKKPDVDLAIKELQDWGFIKKVEVSDVSEIETAYTWNKINSDSREKILETITKLGITQVGRYAQWWFGGIAESIKGGLLC